MNLEKKKWFESASWHTIYLTSLFIITAIILYFALPQEGRFPYEFQKGRPWMHTALIAPYTFAIAKSDATINEERDSLLKSLTPYYLYLDSVDKQQIADLSSKIDEITLKENTEILYSRIVKNKVLTIFEKIYNSGILEQAPGNYPSLNGKSELLIVKKNLAEKVPTGQLYSLKTAYSEANTKLEQLRKSDPDYNKIIEKLHAEDYLAVNLAYDPDKTDGEEQKILDNLTTTYGVIQEGERIVSQGDVISPQTYLIIESLKSTYEKSRGDFSKYYLIIVGKMIFISMLLLTLFLFIYNIRRKLLRSKRDVTFTLLMMVLMIFFCRIIVLSNNISVYIVPFTALALIIRTFLDARLAIFVNTITALIVGFMVPNGYEFVLLSISAGSIAVISQNNLQRRDQLILTSLIIFFVYAFTYIGISLIQEASFASIDWTIIKWFLINAALTLITYLVVFLIEKSFGFVSDVTLIELSYSNQKILRKLAEEAPGTFQHSLQVANLAEGAILKIGGNPLLVRAGALYHDIGKLTDPQFFTENQALGFNPHDSLTFEESAKIIMEHVSRGVELAQKHKIPAQIIDFIKTHHGTTKTSYFFIESHNKNHDKTDESLFTYPGPLPETRETAVVMLADSIEAASRSLDKKDSESLKNLIDTIFQGKIEAKQLDHAPLTFKDITLLKEIFLEKLLNIYHVRIHYPQKES
ncbi:MAG: HDIG domain-containing protein [Mariniphaga sp.]|nr:HDIG domain-containing protein [Mariniphaga sp.]